VRPLPAPEAELTIAIPIGKSAYHFLIPVSGSCGGNASPTTIYEAHSSVELRVIENGDLVIYLKSFIAGVIGMIAAAMLMAVTIVAVAIRNTPPVAPGETIGIDYISIFKGFPTAAWVLLFLAFFLGFLWEYRGHRKALLGVK
jgi:hypothetical protein